MSFEKKEAEGTFKADEIHQAEQILFRFVQNESFPNSKFQSFKYLFQSR